MTTGPPTDASTARDRLNGLGPGLAAASSFGISDVLCKVVFSAGGDVLTLSLIRGVFGLACMAAWLRVGPQPVPHSPRERWIALGLGVLFSGVIVGLFGAIATVAVPIAILTYFCLLYTSPSPRDRQKSRMPSSA